VFDAVCGGAEVLKVIKFIWTLLDIVLFIVPMGLIVIISVDFAKNVIAGKDDAMKKNLGIAIKRIIYCLALFLVEPICGFAIGMLGNTVDVDWAKCIDIARTESDFSEYEIEIPDGDVVNDNDDVQQNGTGGSF